MAEVTKLHLPEHVQARTAKNQDDVPLAKWRKRWPWFDHLMKMQDRYAIAGGNQYAAGITYFSALSLFPILMLIFAIAGFALAARPEVIEDIHEMISAHVSGELGTQITNIIDAAIAQRSAIAGVGAVTALWSGLNWMDTLRYGVSKMWLFNPLDTNFVLRRLQDFVAMILLLVGLIVAFAITAIGNSGLTASFMDLVGLGDTPGLTFVVRGTATAISLLANFVVFLGLLIFLPRGKVPWRSGAKAAVIGAISFEIFKQLGSIFFSAALKNPAGATFGPIIGVMVLLYFVWRIVLYCSAWAATTPESLSQLELTLPKPEVFEIRQEVDYEPATRSISLIALIFTLLGTISGLFLGRRK